MSKIQEALRELRGAEKEAKDDTEALRDSATAEHGTARNVKAPGVRRIKPKFDGPKHVVDRNYLMKVGLIPPPQRAAAIADEFRLIKRPLIENTSAHPGVEQLHSNVIMIASALPGAGKTFCSVNLASSIAFERDLNVVLVDADVAKPHISNAFGLEDRPGLIDVLEDERIAIKDVLVRTDMNDIQVLPAGQRHSYSTELIASDRMTSILSELANRYSDRIIIMDSPPLLATSQAQALAQKVGQIVLVIEYGKTLQTDVRETLDTLDSSKPVNVILNKCVYARAGGYYGGRYGQYGFDRET